MMDFVFLPPKSKGWRLAVGCVQWGNCALVRCLLFLFSPVLSVEIRGLSVRFLWETLVELESLLIRALYLVLFL
jgi:hypothetical protein